MALPDQLRRYPTGAAIDSLAARFRLRNDPGMQDWEYEVADADRLEEFLAALEQPDLTDDERFTLSETVMQCFEDVARTAGDLSRSDEWQRFTSLLLARPPLHAQTMWYWSCWDSTLEDAFYVAGSVRPLWTQIEPLLTGAG